MSIWNKVLIGLISVASLAFFYLAMRTLKTRQYWQGLAHRFEQKIAEVEKENNELLLGSEQQGEDAPSIRKYQTQLTQLITDRGRVWYNCTPKKVDAASGEVSGLAISEPTPHGIADKTVLYAVEEADTGKGGRYLGQFTVQGVAEKQVGLKPARQLSPRELQRLVKSRGPWSLYERMPFDNHEAFADLSEVEKKALLPAATAAEFVKDGAAAAAGDPPQRVADGKYVRRLRDYRLLFERHDIDRTRLSGQCDEAEHDKNYLLAAAADAKKAVAFRQQEIAKLKANLERGRAEAAAVAKLHDALQRKVAEFTAVVTGLIAENKSLAAGIAKIQWDATRRIDERTRVMAQSGDVRK